ncbi:MAG: hypothetical protein KC983_06790, partial [Phycisphaerales bacterium]|nr:hypothetical protein [Phycisphaerales bacterium]
MTDNINRNELLDFAAGRLTGDAYDRVRAVVASDADAAELVAFYRATADLHRDDQASALPSHLRHALTRLYTRTTSPATEQAHEGATGHWLDRLAQHVAQLIFDSRVQIAGVRRDPAGRTFQVSFETGIENEEIDLMVTPTGDGADTVFAVRGAFGAAGVRRIAVCPSSSDTPHLELTTDDAGRFTAQLPPGVWDLHVEHAMRDVVVKGLSL